MPGLKIHIGDIYGQLTIIARVENDIRGRPRWLCKCSCGNNHVVPSCALRSGATKSCGCSKRKHGYGYPATPEFKTWNSMMQRCYNNKNSAYHKYGGKGIQVDPQWHDFLNFLKYIIEALGPKPSGATLDRWPNITGNYEPGNVRWATYTQQNRNRGMIHLNKSGYKGVHFSKSANKFTAQIKHIHLGVFADPIEAAKAYDLAAVKYFGESAVTNKMLGNY